MFYKILFYIISALFICLWGCSEDFINLSPKTSLNSSDYYVNKSQMETAVTAAYASLAADGQYGYNFIHLMEIRSDNSSLVDFARSGRRYGDIDFFTVTSENAVIEQTWRECYNCINRCNIVLDRIDGIKDMTEQEKSARKGEMLYVRSLTYFNLVRLWGDVPIVIHETTDPMESFNVGRQPEELVFQQIISDLKTAVTILPEVGDKTGHATQGAAISLLGEVYLWLKDYNNVVSVLTPLVGKYNLLSNYSDVFSNKNENNAEVIFAVQYAGNQLGVGSKYANLFAIDVSLVGVGSAYGDNFPSKSLINSFSANDKRLSTNIGYLYGTAAYCKKYIERITTDFDGSNNFIVSRYADILLMLSEAYNEIGYNNDIDGATTSSFIYLNQIRLRAGLNKLTSADLADQSSFRNALIKERRVEFAFENKRWFDLVRTGNAKLVSETATTQGKITTYQSYMDIYPIPEREIITMNNQDKMYQNTGYK